MNNNGIVQGFEIVTVTPETKVTGNSFYDIRTGVNLPATTVVPDNGLLHDLWRKTCHNRPKTLPQSTGG